MKRRTGCLVILVALACISVTAYSVRDRILPMAAAWLDVGREPERADCVMALSGEARTRPQRAAELINAGWAVTVLLTQPVASGDGQDGNWPASDELYRGVLVQLGIPEARIVTLGNGVSSTADEADVLAAYLAEHPDLRVSVVTSAYHTRRARWVFAQKLGDQMKRVSFVSAPNPGFDAQQWWKSEAGFRCVKSEYVKLPYYWCRYGNGLVWIGSSLVAGILFIGFRAAWSVKR